MKYYYYLVFTELGILSAVFTLKQDAEKYAQSLHKSTVEQIEKKHVIDFL